MFPGIIENNSHGKNIQGLGSSDPSTRCTIRAIAPLLGRKKLMRKVRVAVVGCGNVAEKYVPHLQRSTAVDLVAVCDPLVDRARSFAQAYTIEHTFQDIDQMLSTLDFELLANLTPMPLHAPINRLALEAGRNVWCE